MSSESMPISHRILLALILTAGCVLIMTSTEQCFDNADVKNALKVVQLTKASDAAPTIPEALALKHRGVKTSEIGWSGRVTNSCYGFVRVRAAVPAPGHVAEYIFDVDVGQRRLHPANDNARGLMTALKDGALAKPKSTE
jgi:hypothetical protein